MQVQTVQLPPDVQYVLDCMLEHHEIDAGTHTAIRLYAPRAEVIRIIDRSEADTPRQTMWNRLSVAETLAVRADGIIADLPIRERGAIAYAGLQHMRTEVRSVAWFCATAAHEDQIQGGCMEPYKRGPLSNHNRRYELSPRQRRKLYGQNWIRRYVKRTDEVRHKRAMGTRIVRRAEGIPRDLVADAAALLAEQIAAQHEGFRRTNMRAITTFAEKDLRKHYGRRDRRRHRAVIKRAARTAEAILGHKIVSDFVGGHSVLLEGQTLDLDVLRTGSSALLGHGGLAICAVAKGSGRRLADLCIYHEQTPALDQLVALGLAMAAGDEADIINTANLSRVSETGLEHPLIAERGKASLERPWRPRDEKQVKNEAYWEDTKPIWIEATGVAVLGREWSKAA